MDNKCSNNRSSDITGTKPLLRALAGKADHIPPVWLMRQAGRYLPEYREIRARAGSFLDLCYNPELASEVTLQPIRRYGFDAAIVFADILLVPHALGQPLSFVTGEGPRLEAIENTADLAALRPEGIHQTLSPVYETLGRVRDALPPEVALIGFAGSPWTVATYMVEGRGGTDFSRILGWAHGEDGGFDALIDIITTATIDYLGRQVEAGAEVLQLFDSWAGALGGADFERFSIAPTARIVAALGARYPAVPIIGFPRGAGAALAAYASGTGVAAVSLDTAVDMEQARAGIGGSIVLQGNLDPALLVAGGAAMAAEVERILKAMAGRAFIFNLGHGIVPQTPPENVAALVDLVRRGAVG